MLATATREQAGIQTSTSAAPTATVVYDSADSKISLNVIISLPEGAPEPSVFAVPFNIPPHQWTVRWTLEPGENLDSVSFSGEGLVLPGRDDLPAKVEIISSAQQSPTEWEATFSNEVIGANSFNYTIEYTATTFSGQRLGPLYVHDPTIALTPDPIG